VIRAAAPLLFAYKTALGGRKLFQTDLFED
jgi:hypothetical protein